MSHKMEKEFDGMDNVVHIMNELYNVGNELNMQGCGDIELPQIAVCGSQSSGKTSVLESISGEAFLPRGVDIQTRCPIVLQLINSKGGGKWVEFLHQPGEKYEDMEEVMEEMEVINEEIIKKGQVVSEEPITLKMYSPNVPNLTLVDLPGLVENPVEGQPLDLVDKINDLVLKYISNPNCIILAISAATTDIADSKSIRMSKQVDPEGRRTLGVLTKLDLMDEGTDVKDVLSGKKIKLDLGFIGVVNRSFKEVKEGKSLQDQLEKEYHFLKRHYPTLADVNGTRYLIQRISKLLLKTTKDTLPGIKRSIEQLMDKCQEDLEEIGEPIEMAEKPKDAILLELVTKFLEAYTAQVDGRRRNLELKSLNASSKIKQVFDLFLGKEFDKLVATKTLTDVEIDNAILNSHALHNRRIDYDDAFQELAKREIKSLCPFVSKCTREVNKEMKNAIEASCNATVKQHPKLFQKIKQVALELIDERFKDCNKYLDDYLNAEASIARTIRGGFRDKNGSSKDEEDVAAGTQTPIGEGNAHVKEKEEGEAAKKNDRGKDDYHESIAFEGQEIHRANVKRDIQLYFNRAKMQIMEHVGRGIVYKLVYGTSDLMMCHMLQKLHGTELAMELLSDGHVDVVQKRRKATNDLLETYEKANEVVDMLLLKINNL